MGTRKVAIITGASKGIGQGVAMQLALQGLAVAVTSRNKQHAEHIAEEIKKAGGEALGLEFNLEHETTLSKLIDDTVAHYGRLDILVNNAMSTSCVPPLDNLSPEQISFAINANLTNTLLLTQLARPHLKKTEGNVLNIGSVVVNRHILGMPLYAIIKGAIVQMTKALAAEWASDNIRVNCINPGFIRSSSLDELKLPPEALAAIERHCVQFHPLGNRIGEPKDVGDLATYLTSDAANLMTGTVINLDAGLSIQGFSMQPAG
ncbi:MAG: SDR family NAD(P)-dependent oxidoreductase [Cellvibrionaceae bacterium]